MKKKDKNKGMKIFTTIIFLVCFVGISIFVQINEYHPSNDWVGYWGNVLGSVIGVLGAYLVLQSQLSKDKEENDIARELDQEKFKAESVDNTFFNLLNIFKSTQDNIPRDLTDENKSKIVEMLERIKLEKDSMSGSNLEKDDFSVVKKIVNEVGDEYHAILGTYFRSFYVIIKYLDENEWLEKNKKDKRKEKYLRILRSLLSSEEILIIFYNAFYYSKGEGSKKVFKNIAKDMNGKGTFFCRDKEAKKIISTLDYNKKNEESKTIPDLTYFAYKEFIFGELDFMNLVQEKNKSIEPWILDL